MGFISGIRYLEIKSLTAGSRLSGFSTEYSNLVDMMFCNRLPQLQRHAIQQKKVNCPARHMT